MTTPIDIAELERLERAATPGPWQSNEYTFSLGIYLPNEKLWLGHQLKEHNSKFIAASRNALPELIASLKIAVKELEQHAKDTETHDGCQASKKALAEIRKRVTL